MRRFVRLGDANPETPSADAGKGGMESTQELTARALRLQHEAIKLSQQMCGDNTELKRWMAVAKQQGMTWDGGRAFAIERMKAVPV